MEAVITTGCFDHWLRSFNLIGEKSVEDRCNTMKKLFSFCYLRLNDLVVITSC